MKGAEPRIVLNPILSTFDAFCSCHATSCTYYHKTSTGCSQQPDNCKIMDDGSLYTSWREQSLGIIMIQQGPKFLATTKTGMASQSESPYDERLPKFKLCAESCHFLAVKDYENHMSSIKFHPRTYSSCNSL